MKVAAVQYRPPKGNPPVAREELAGLIEQAKGAEIIVCPEMATTGYVWPDAAALRPFAEAADGATFQRLCPLARTLGTLLVVGFAEQAGDQLFNSALVIGPTGSLVGVYRKVLLYEADWTWASPGNRRVLVKHGETLVAPGICMDINDDGFVGFLHAENPGIVAFCTNWVEEGIDVHDYWRERLTGWSGTLIAANTWGTDGTTMFSGQSAILQDGQTLATAERRGDAVLMVETRKPRL